MEHLTESSTPLHEHVVVLLGAERFALPMENVAEVGRPPAVTRVPGLPAWLAGVANWRGRVLAVVDLRPLLGSAPGPLDRSSRLVVLQRSSVVVGLLTEGVEGTELLADEAVEPALAHLSDGAAGLLRGQTTDHRGPCGVFDVDALFALPDRLPRPRRGV